MKLIKLKGLQTHSDLKSRKKGEINFISSIFSIYYCMSKKSWRPFLCIDSLHKIGQTFWICMVSPPPGVNQWWNFYVFKGKNLVRIKTYF